MPRKVSRIAKRTLLPLKEPVQADDLNGFWSFGDMGFNFLQRYSVFPGGLGQIFVFCFGFGNPVAFCDLDTDGTIGRLYRIDPAGEYGAAAAPLPYAKGGGVPEHQSGHGGSIFGAAEAS